MKQREWLVKAKLCPFYLREKAPVPFVLVRKRGGGSLVGVRKISSSTDFGPWTIQLLASQCLCVKVPSLMLD